MNIEEVKAKLGLGQINLSIDKDEEGKETGWLRQWDNDQRIAIVMHEDTAKQLKEGENLNLGIKDDVQKTGPKGPYILKTIVAYTPVDYTF